jgi:DNA replication protein DnaC
MLTIAEMRKRAEEHQRRKESDPVYRAECEREEAEARAREEIENAERSEHLRRAMLEGIRSAAGIPVRAWPFLDKPERTTAYVAAEDFGASSESILVLAGGVGCGKTVAASAWLERALVAHDAKIWERGFRTEREARGSVVKAIDLARAGTFDREFWDDLSAVDFLVVDDLGTEPLDDKGWMVANIRALIDQRYDAERKTILTANLNFDGFRARYCADGGRLLDRIKERGAFVEIADGSLRRPPPPCPTSPAACAGRS